MQFHSIRDIIHHEISGRKRLSHSELHAVMETIQRRVVFVFGEINKLLLFEEGERTMSVRCTTARKGFGNTLDSEKTPLGLHRINGRIGKWVDPYLNFVNREPREIVTPTKPWEIISSMVGRILTLSGEEHWFNDSTEQRNIYIHGTRNHWATTVCHNPRISGGCIGLHPDDVISLFDATKEGDVVYITGK